jgi:hypothetical protein
VLELHAHLARVRRALDDPGRDARLRARRRYREMLMVAAVKVLCKHHPIMRMLQLSWQHGGEDPWRLLHMLDADLRPLDGSSDVPVRPRYLDRQQAVRFAFGQVAAESNAQGQQAIARGVREAVSA